MKFNKLFMFLLSSLAFIEASAPNADDVEKKTDTFVRTALFGLFPNRSLPEQITPEVEHKIASAAKTLMFFKENREQIESAICEHLRQIPFRDSSILSHFCIESLRRDFFKVALLVTDKIFLLPSPHPKVSLLRIFDISVSALGCDQRTPHFKETDRNVMVFLSHNIKRFKQSELAESEELIAKMELLFNQHKAFGCSNLLAYFLYFVPELEESGQNFFSTSEHMDFLTALGIDVLQGEDTKSFISFVGDELNRELSKRRVHPAIA